MIYVRHFEEAMKFVRRSVSDMELRKYEAIASQQLYRVGLDSSGLGGTASTNNTADHFQGAALLDDEDDD